MLKKLFVMTLVLALGSFISLGCKKEQPKPKVDVAPVTDAANKAADEAAKAAEEAKKAADAAAEKAGDAATKAVEEVKK